MFRGPAPIGSELVEDSRFPSVGLLLARRTFLVHLMATACDFRWALMVLLALRPSKRSDGCWFTPL